RAPSAFQTRPWAGGAAREYGLDISPNNFVGHQRRRWCGHGCAQLVDGVVDAANIFSHSPAIPQHHLVTLDDPKHNFMAGNIVPLLNSQKKSDHLKDVLDAVSAKLTTEGLAELNAAVSGNSGVDPDQAARNWVQRNGFDHPIRR
ncbi:glycine/betaine ABC transporter substrate-binding protein, partial [Mycolicibacterium vaccae]|nr:glycine/betaine ABC transporter substrate-binding protein [Mycolicibacterium vaccae]